MDDHLKPEKKEIVESTIGLGPANLIVKHKLIFINLLYKHHV